MRWATLLCWTALLSAVVSFSTTLACTQRTQRARAGARRHCPPYSPSPCRHTAPPCATTTSASTSPTATACATRWAAALLARGRPAGWAAVGGAVRRGPRDSSGLPLCVSSACRPSRHSPAPYHCLPPSLPPAAGRLCAQRPAMPQAQVLGAAAARGGAAGAGELQGWLHCFHLHACLVSLTCSLAGSVAA